MYSRLCQFFQWTEIKDLTSAFLTEHAGQLGEGNIITLKLKEHLMDAHIGSPPCTYSGYNNALLC